LGPYCILPALLSILVANIFLEKKIKIIEMIKLAATKKNNEEFLSIDTTSNDFNTNAERELKMLQKADKQRWLTGDALNSVKKSVFFHH
jgi:hypothetical protein